MPFAEYDLRFLQAGIDVLEKYLLSSDLYWPAGAQPPVGEPPYPRLTLGAIALAQARLHARRLNPDQHAQLAGFDEHLNMIRSRWRAAWGQKVSVDFRARLKLWRDFIEDYRQNPDANYDRYGYEVGRRVQLQLLEPDAAGLAEPDLELKSTLDRVLRTLLVTGPFIWEPELELGFPKESFWFLYGRLPKKRE